MPFVFGHRSRTAGATSPGLTNNQKLSFHKLLLRALGSTTKGTPSLGLRDPPWKKVYLHLRCNLIHWLYIYQIIILKVLVSHVLCFATKQSCLSFCKHFYKPFYIIMDDFVLSFVSKLAILDEVYSFICHFQMIKTTRARMNSSFRSFNKENFLFLKIFVAALED